LMNDRYDGLNSVFFKLDMGKWNKANKEIQNKFMEKFPEYCEYIGRLKRYFIISLIVAFIF
jgi:hypothetical protein